MKNDSVLNCLNTNGIIYGKVLNRTIRDKNVYEICGDITNIFLYNNKNRKIAETIIDTKNLEKCINIKWHLSTTGYVKATINKKAVFLSWIITGKKSHNITIVDHKDGNPLNNLENNFQTITRHQNQMKQNIYKNNKSGYKGVCWNKKRGKWGSSISKNGIHYCLGNHISKTEAALAYNEKAKELFGEFATLNVI